MRTKKALSVFFAVLMTLSVFGVVSASAAGVKGWENVKTVTLEKVNYNATYKEVYWETFTAGDTAGSVDFWTMAAANDIQAKYTVTYVPADPKIPPPKDPIIDNKDATVKFTNGGVTVFPEKSSGKLTVMVELKNDMYGEYTIALTLTKVGEEPKSGQVTISLVSMKEYEDTLAEAEKMAAKTDRYSKDFITRLKTAIATAKQLVAIDANRCDTAVSTLKEVMDEPEYILTGWEWLDGVLGFLDFAGIWKVIDTINDFFSFITDAFDWWHDTWLYKTIFSNINWLSVLGGFGSLLIALVGLIIPGL